jgi:hypothetical protein
MITSIQHPGETWFPTENISLAAILACLGFKLRPYDPITLDYSTVNKQKIARWWFSPDLDWNGHRHTCALVDNWYRNKAEFELANPDHPIRFMRAALDSRQWLIDVIYGEKRLKESLPGVLRFGTGDIKFASILIAGKYHLLEVEKSSRVFYFLDDGKIQAKQAEFKLANDPEKPLQATPIAYMREVLLWADYLRKLIKHPELHAQIMMMCKGRPLLISENASRETLHKFFGC